VRVYLVRHAEAEPGSPDELRALTPGGRAAARALGRRLRDEAGAVDAVLSSPLRRARETAEAIAAELATAAAVDELLAPGATADSIRELASGAGETIVAVGHQPDCSRIVAALTNGPEPPFAPAGMFRLDLPA